MTDTAQLERIVERLQRAAGPDRDIDAAICKACNIPWSSDEEGNFGGYGIMPRRVKFTSSIDAARTLVPEGWYVRKLNQFSDGWYCTVVRGEENYSGDQKPPAIALCIAALKARIALARAPASTQSVVGEE